VKARTKRKLNKKNPLRGDDRQARGVGRKAHLKQKITPRWFRVHRGSKTQKKKTTTDGMLNNKKGYLQKGGGKNGDQRFNGAANTGRRN